MNGRVERRRYRKNTLIEERRGWKYERVAKKIKFFASI
jgi:hypothetical protein